MYALGAVDFIVRPGAALASLGKAGGERMDFEPAGFYNALASAYMATIAALALTAGRDPDGGRDLVPPLLVAKAASSAAMLYRYQQTKKKGFAVGAAVDAFLLGVTAGLYSASDS
jgi:hypothetical protein